jgi:hypothetical protein
MTRNFGKARAEDNSGAVPIFAQRKWDCPLPRPGSSPSAAPRPIAPWALLALFAAAPVVRPSTCNAEPRVEVKKLLLHPAPEPRAALGYRLLPPFLEQRPGNAAVLYNKVAIRYGDAQPRDAQEFAEWAKTPLAKLPAEEVRKTLTEYVDVLEDLQRAARCEDCDWQLGVRERGPDQLVLTELQSGRAFARLLAVKARLELVDGDVDAAIHTLQTGLAEGRHMAEGPTLVHALVGANVCTIICEQLEDLIQDARAPNLYWALTVLPDPLIDARRAADAEISAPYLYLPELRQVEDRSHTAEHWRDCYYRLAAQTFQWSGSELSPWQQRLAAAALAVRGYPIARQCLIERGWQPDELDAMPVSQVLLIHTVRTYEELAGMCWKWAFVPYTKGGERFSWRDFDREATKEVLPFAQQVGTGGRFLTVPLTRCRQRIAILRTIEAVRSHAAEHGQLPAKLSDVTQLPVPVDPVTENPFQYQASGATAVLKAAPAGGYPERRYEITLAR